MAGGEIVAQSLVDWNDCVGACILLINIAIKYINKGEEWVGGGMATESFADRQVCAPHTDNIKLLRLCVCLQMLQIRERAPAVATVSTHS